MSTDANSFPYRGLGDGPVMLKYFSCPEKLPIWGTSDGSQVVFFGNKAHRIQWDKDQQIYVEADHE